MIEDGIGEVVGDVAETAIDLLADIGADAAIDAFAPDRRRRRGCWRLFLIVLVVALIVWGVVALSG